jgi:hypothetical protein
VLAFVSASLAVSAQVPPPAPNASAPDGIYSPFTNRDIYQRISGDFQEISRLTNQVLEGRPLPAGEILTVYEEARVARVGEEARQLRGFARDPARVQDFPESAAFYGSATFLDDPVIDAIVGIRSAEGYTPGQRREAIQKGIQRILYHWAARYVLVGAERLNPGVIDEAWAIYMGQPMDGSYPNSLAATARSREQNFNRLGSIDAPLRQALSDAHQAAGKGDAAAYAEAARRVYSRFNAIFYLGAARYMNEPLRSVDRGDADAAAVQLAEGYAFYRSIQPTVGTGDPEADATIVAYFLSDPLTLSTQRRNDALAALNRAFKALLLEPGDMVTPATFN